MNKAELVEALAVHFHGNKAEASRALKAVMDTIVEQTVLHDRVSLTGFGVFERVHRPARMVRNPASGSTKPAPAVDVPRFRPSQQFRDLMAGEKAAVRATVGRRPTRRPARRD